MKRPKWDGTCSLSGYNQASEKSSHVPRPRCGIFGQASLALHLAKTPAKFPRDPSASYEPAAKLDFKVEMRICMYEALGCKLISRL